jgi:hypothetical protein
MAISMLHRLHSSSWFLLAAALYIAVPRPSEASVVQWVLNDVTLSDGETLNGKFDFGQDVNGGVYSNIDISNNGSPTWGATTFVQYISTGNNLGLEAINGPPAVNDTVLVFNFPQGLTEAGGTVPLEQNSPTFYRCTVADCSSISTSAQDIVLVASGNLTAVPLPAAAWLMLGGLCGLGALARKKRGT